MRACVRACVRAHAFFALLPSRPFVIKTNTSALTSHTIVVATGADSRWLGVPGEEEHKGGGISSCATCDGWAPDSNARARCLAPPPLLGRRASLDAAMRQYRIAE